MKKFLITLTLLLAPVLFFAPQVHAQETLGLCSGDELTDKAQPWFCINVDDFGGLLGNVINLAFVVAVILAFGYLIYGGIRWITSGGDKGGVENARNTIIAAIIGLILVFLAYVIVNFVVYFLTGSSLSQVEIPTLNPSSTPANNANNVTDQPQTNIE